MPTDQLTEKPIIRIHTLNNIRDTYLVLEPTNGTNTNTEQYYLLAQLHLDIYPTEAVTLVPQRTATTRTGCRT